MASCFQHINECLYVVKSQLRSHWAKILFTEGIHSRKQARPKFERKRATEPVEMGRELPDDVMGYGLPVLEKVRAIKPPKEADQHRAPPPPKNYGADISTLIRMIEAGEL